MGHGEMTEYLQQVLGNGVDVVVFVVVCCRNTNILLEKMGGILAERGRKEEEEGRKERGISCVSIGLPFCDSPNILNESKIA